MKINFIQRSKKVPANTLEFGKTFCYVDNHYMMCQYGKDSLNRYWLNLSNGVLEAGNDKEYFVTPTNVEAIINEA